MHYLGLPLWAEFLIKGILIFAALCSGAVTLTRAGKNPHFTFLMIVPVISILALWYFAFTPWPKADPK